MKVTPHTSVIVSARFASEPFHADSAACLDSLLRQGAEIVLPWLARVECVAAVARKTANPELAMQAARLLDAIPAMRWFAVDERVTADAERLAAHHRLRAADAIYMAVALRCDATCITLDQEMRKCASEGTRCVTPSEWMALHADR